ncbi:MAG TPA: glycoside hydrolase family 130 protein [Armatimonadota bacterium]|nr:glycoside hydrolase family 130 protein [Armatimonadota bacterium]
MNIDRYPENPLVTPTDVPPSREDLEVVCVFNAGVARYKDEVILLMRVAERGTNDSSVVRVPVFESSGLCIREFDRSDPRNDFSDPRIIKTPEGILLTTISHLRIARSKDGRHFTVDPKPALFPNRESEAYGLEDPRITEIGGIYYIHYKSVSPLGICVSLAVTRDFEAFEKKGIIFGPENTDVCIFPEKVGGRYVALHRPVSGFAGSPNMWIAYSPDLLYWGDHRFLMGVNRASWDSERVGGGAVPVKTDRGWLEIYHAADFEGRYCLGAVLLDLDEPHKIIARGKEPIFVPEAEYETTGFVPNVVFTCGALVDGDSVSIYYGAADTVIAGADMSISEILETLDARL